MPDPSVRLDDRLIRYIHELAASLNVGLCGTVALMAYAGVFPPWGNSTNRVLLYLTRLTVTLSHNREQYAGTTMLLGVMTVAFTILAFAAWEAVAHTPARRFFLGPVAALLALTALPASLLYLQIRIPPGLGVNWPAILFSVVVVSYLLRLGQRKAEAAWLGGLCAAAYYAFFMLLLWRAQPSQPILLFYSLVAPCSLFTSAVYLRRNPDSSARPVNVGQGSQF